MKKIIISLFFALGFQVFSQDRFVTLGNASDGQLITEGALSFDRSNTYMSNSGSVPISQNYFGIGVKLEYGLFWRFKLTSNFEMLNFKPQNGLFGVKYEMPFASKKVLKNGNSMAIVVVPQANFIFPMSNYDTESLLAIGNKNLGVGGGATFWIPIYRINADLKIYTGYNYYFNGVPSAFQLFTKFGKILGPIYLGLHFDWQKSFGQGTLFSSSFKALPVSYLKLGLEATYTHEESWSLSLEPSFLFRGNNVRKSLGVELRFRKMFNLGR